MTSRGIIGATAILILAARETAVPAVSPPPAAGQHDAETRPEDQRGEADCEDGPPADGIDQWHRHRSPEPAPHEQAEPDQRDVEGE